MTSGLSKTARLIYRIVKDIAGESVHWEVRRESYLERNIYHIFAPRTPAMEDYLQNWGITAKLQKKNIRRACTRERLAGAFMGAGSRQFSRGKLSF